LLHWPRWLGEEPDAEAIEALRAASACPTGAGAGPAPAQSLAQALFGCTAHEWLQHDNWPDVLAWAAAGRTAPARFVRQLHACPAAADDKPVAFLPAPAAAWLRPLALAAFDAPDFTRLPLWQGQPAETGALARLRDDALVGDLQAAPSRLLARQMARLRELALLLAGRWQPALGALSLGPACALAWVDNARGLLVHAVQLDGQRVQRARIVAPTEWNFHPAGALARGLQGAPAADAQAALLLARRLIISLDPCVACHVELDDDA
jgi:uptake hydrogenase large subunit